jgi:MFS family permease
MLDEETPRHLAQEAGAVEVAAAAGTPAGGPSRARVPLGSWYVLAVLTLISVVAYMDRMALSILTEPIKAEFALSDQQMGLLSGLAFAAFYSVLGIPLARFADRSSRVRLLSICLTLWSLMTALCGFTRTFPQLFLARMGVGVGEAGCVPPAHSLIGDIFPRERRTLAITIFQSGAVVGLGGGLFVIGLLAQNFGWRTSLQAIGVAGAPLAILVAFTIREPPRPDGPKATREPALRAIGALVRRPAMRHLAIGYALSQISAVGISQWTPAFLMRSFGMTLADVGAWTAVSGTVGGVFGLLSGGVLAAWLTPRDPRWELWIPALAIATCAPISALMFLSSTPLAAVLLRTVAAYIGAIGGGVALAAVQSFTEPHRRATAVSIMLFLSSLLGTGFGPYLIGVLSDVLKPALGQESLRYALLIGCSIMAWSTVHFLLAGRSALRDRVA